MPCLRESATARRDVVLELRAGRRGEAVKARQELFVDVDDTLVTWLGGTEPHPYGHGSESWEPNEAVRAYVRKWRSEHPEGIVIVWSGGGADYARTWAERLLPDDADFAMAKSNVTHTAERTFIDDSPFAVWASRNIHPRDLPVPASDALRNGDGGAG